MMIAGKRFNDSAIVLRFVPRRKQDLATRRMMAWVCLRPATSPNFNFCANYSISF